MCIHVSLWLLTYQYLNIKLTDIQIVDEQKYPHLVCIASSSVPELVTYIICLTFHVYLEITTSQIPVKHVFIRGSVVRYVHLPKDEVDIQLLQDSARRSTRPSAEETAK